MVIVVRPDIVMSKVLGDSGVGKTSLAHLICHNENIINPSWTIGCSVEVKLHEYKEGLPQQKTYFIELWDIGGSSNHRNTRSIFYNPVHGIILVHDLTNRKSEQNLQKWLMEVLNCEADSKMPKSFDDFDSEQFVGSTQIPILVVGTKLDLSGGLRSQKTVTFADECGADEILMDTRKPSSLAAGSSSAVKLSRFFDKVIEKKFYLKSPMSPFAEKRRPFNAASPPKLFHSKLAAQCSHAAVECFRQGMKKSPEITNAWVLGGEPKIVLRSDSPGEDNLKKLAQSASKVGLVAAIIRDAGRTELSRGTVTVLGIGPGSVSKIDEVTSHLRLL
ncbi:hypothetical protein RUM44_006914 [Polyplax serrata]|uniref:peptidyl-tRNA hydrolase n=1 Tax=Polyplax serrata TaxID=468196 RepID=A0ABR1AZ86_POLSC